MSLYVCRVCDFRSRYVDMVAEFSRPGGIYRCLTEIATDGWWSDNLK